MEKEYEILLGELIGLARATDGSEHLINPSATALIRDCLSRENGDTEGLLERVEAEKRNMVPNCFTCANPCGRTSACDLSQWPAGELRDLRYVLLEDLSRLAREKPDAREILFYHGLIAVGMKDYDREDLQRLIRLIRQARET